MTKVYLDTSVLIAAFVADEPRHNIVKRMTVVSLTAKETFRMLSEAEENGIRGGGVYDALHLAAARKVNADEIFTLNRRHFSAFAPDLSSRLRVPGSG